MDVWRTFKQTVLFLVRLAAVLVLVNVVTGLAVLAISLIATI